MKRYHRRRTCSHTSPRRSPTMETLHETRFIECRWWNNGWTVKTVVTWRSSASIIPAPGLITSIKKAAIQGHANQKEGNTIGLGLGGWVLRPGEESSLGSSLSGPEVHSPVCCPPGGSSRAVLGSQNHFGSRSSICLSRRLVHLCVS